jgi:DNA-directed RNA polymerase subunit RPC12/RpoP
MTPWIVEVQKAVDYYAPKIECHGLGHASYRCGHCMKGYFKVKGLNDHDEKCTQCGYTVSVRRRDDYRGI